MVEQLVRAVPERWREIAGVVVTPIIWIPPMQRAIAQFFLESPSLWIAAVKYVLLLFPAALWVVAVWCTQEMVQKGAHPFRTADSRTMSSRR